MPGGGPVALAWKMEWHRGSLCFASPPPTSSLNAGVLKEHSGSLLLSNLLSLSLQAPHFPPGSDLLLKAASIYHSFLTWPVPYCDTFRELLTFISNELKAPGEGSCPAPGAPNPALPPVLCHHRTQPCPRGLSPLASPISFLPCFLSPGSAVSIPNLSFCRESGSCPPSSLRMVFPGGPAPLEEQGRVVFLVGLLCARSIPGSPSCAAGTISHMGSNFLAGF